MEIKKITDENSCFKNILSYLYWLSLSDFIFIEHII